MLDFSQNKGMIMIALASLVGVIFMPFAMRKLTFDEFISNFKEKYPESKYGFEHSAYDGSKVKMTITCPTHGDFQIRPNDLMNGYGCPDCGGTKAYGTEEFIRKATFVHHGFFSYGHAVYEGSMKEVTVTCPFHGDISVKANNHLNGANCKQCSLEGRKHEITKLPKVNKSTRELTNEQFLQMCREKYGDRYGYGKVEYSRSCKKVTILCNVCGNEFSITPNHFLHGEGCPTCGGHINVTTEMFVERARAIHGEKYSYEKSVYVGTHKNLIITCRKHNRDFLMEPANHINGRQGCPYCNISHIEEEIEMMLKMNGIRYEREKRFDWLVNKGKMRLDFYLPEYGIALEGHGLQHFKPVSFTAVKDPLLMEKDFEKVRAGDILKHDLCEKHGIPIIYYTNLKEEFDYPYEVLRNKDLLLNEILKRDKIC